MKLAGGSGNEPGWKAWKRGCLGIRVDYSKKTAVLTRCVHISLELILQVQTPTQVTIEVLQCASQSGVVQVHQSLQPCDGVASPLGSSLTV